MGTVVWREFYLVNMTGDFLNAINQTIFLVNSVIFAAAIGFYGALGYIGWRLYRVVKTRNSFTFLMRVYNIGVISLRMASGASQRSPRKQQITCKYRMHSRLHCFARNISYCHIENRIINEPIEISLQEGDFLLLYSDGLPEAVNPEGEWFGFENLIKMIEKLDTDNRSSNEISMDIKRQIQKLSDYHLAVDTTIICLKV